MSHYVTQHIRFSLYIAEGQVLGQVALKKIKNIFYVCLSYFKSPLLCN